MNQPTKMQPIFRVKGLARGDQGAPRGVMHLEYTSCRAASEVAQRRHACALCYASSPQSVQRPSLAFEPMLRQKALPQEACRDVVPTPC